MKKVVKKSVKKIKIIKKSDNFFELIFPNKQILYLIGTVHISPESVALVSRTITSKKPKNIFVELDPERRKNLFQKIKEIDILKIIKTKRTLFFLSYLFLSILQKKFSEKTGSAPGEEFKKTIEEGEKIKATIFLVDRNANTTLKRIYRSLKLREKLRLFYSFFSFEEEVVKKNDDLDYKKLISKDIVNQVIKELGAKFATIKKVLIDERDVYMTKNILKVITKSKKNPNVAVVGAGHLPGMLEFFKNPELLEQYNLADLETIPPKSWLSKLFPFLFLGIILAVFSLGFIFSSNENVVYESFGVWVLANGLFCALGATIALAHPLTILLAFVAAPITSLNPTIGAGMVVSLVQTLIAPPKVKDFEGFSLKITDFKYWWKNRLTKILLVFIFSSLGSAIGTIVALPLIINLF